MSNAQKRLDFAVALSTVDGINGFPNKPAVPNQGDAWPQWRGMTVNVNGYLYESEWVVLVALPNADDVTADSYVDDKGMELAAALRPVMFVETFAPANLGSDTAPIYGLMISGRSE